MRLHRLDIEGFGPFRDRQTVDFDAYAADGIFLISGRTGSGKSSVLDGVCFALYGGVPRYSSGERAVRSDHCAADDRTEVVLEFTARGRRLRVTRAPDWERPKLRGTGTTLEKHRAVLEEHSGGAWQGVASGVAEVSRELDDIVGLSKEQFLQVILLAQNRFAQFLHASVDERRRLLRRLFDTPRYEDYAAALQERRKSAAAESTDRTARVRRLLDEILDSGDVVPARDDLAAALGAAGVVVARADYAVEGTARDRDAADVRFRAAEAAHREAAGLVERLAARDRSRAALTVLEQQETRVAHDRTRHALAVDAEELRGPLAGVENAAAASERARGARLTAQSALQDATDAADPQSLADRLTGELASWHAALAREIALGALDAERADAARREAALLGAAGDLDARRAVIPVELATLDERIGVDRALSAGAAVAGRTVADLAVRVAAAGEAERLAVVRSHAEAAHGEALDSLGAATVALTALLRRRLAGHAAELAAGLVEGEPCVVCGARAHPAPAEGTDDPVGDGDLAVAEQLKEAAVAREGDAARAAREAREAHAAAAEIAGGASAEELDGELAAARRAQREADAAARRVEVDTAARGELVRLATAVEAERAAVAADLLAARESIARLDERRAAAASAIAEARGAFETVALRIADAEARRDAARAFAAAVEGEVRSTAAEHEARGVLDAALAASRFASIDQARDALLERDARIALAETVSAHDTELRLERERLLALELDLADAPDEVDLAEVARRRQVDRDAWVDAIGDASRATQDASRLRALLDQATVAHAGIAELVRDAEVVARLADTLVGRPPNTRRMDLETFVLAAELEEIVVAANLRLTEMSSGRFQLAYTDALVARGGASGLGLEIVDAYTGRSRPAASLSGGETFLASLSLALGLAEVVTARAGGTRLDTLFVDEGFGHLDGDTLDLAMQTLDELRQGGRTVGVISHVESMKERLTAQLVVESLPGGPSVVRQDVGATASVAAAHRAPATPAPRGWGRA